MKTTSGVKGVEMVLTRQRMDLASGTLPREEEEPPVLSYAAAEKMSRPRGGSS